MKRTVAAFNARIIAARELREQQMRQGFIECENECWNSGWWWRPMRSAAPMRSGARGRKRALDRRLRIES